MVDGDAPQLASPTKQRPTELFAGGEVAFDDIVERDARRHRQWARAGLLDPGTERRQLPLGGGAGIPEAPAGLDPGARELE